MGRTIGVTFHRDCRNANGWSGCDLAVEIGVAWLALDKGEPLAIVVDHDLDVIGVLE